MADIEITVDGGTQKRLLTAGKYCDRDIVVTATGNVEPEPPDDGATRIYLEIPYGYKNETELVVGTFSLTFEQSVADGALVDWGDGTPQHSSSSVGSVTLQHDYVSLGSYIIAIYTVNGCELSFNAPIFDVANENYPQRMAVKKVTFGSSVVGIGDSVLIYCSCVTDVEFLSNVPLDKGVLAFRGCYALSKIPITPSTTLIPRNFCYNCYSIRRIEIPESVEKISTGAFTLPYGLKELVLKRADPPTLENSNSLFQMPDDCIIYVPRGSLEAYQTATNWATYADYMQEEPE